MLLQTTSRFERFCRSDLRGRDDRWLVEAAKKGDNEAFEVLARRYQRVVLSILRRATPNQEDAEDLTQQTFLKAFAHLQTFRGTASFSTWLVRIALNEGLMLRRKAWRLRETSMHERGDGDDGPLPYEPPDLRPSPEESFTQQERRWVLFSLLGSLTPATRAAIQICDLEERPVKEAAALMGISVSAVKSRTSRGRKTLRQRLEPYFVPAKTAVERAPHGQTPRSGQESAFCAPVPAREIQ